MNPPLHILHLENNPADVRLVKDQLAAEHIVAEVRQVSRRADLVAALASEPWDLIISDDRLADGFTGLEALKLVREKHHALPFIFLSDTPDEQVVVESLKAGATDYLLKQKRGRLPAAVRRAVAEANEQKRHKMTEAELRHSEKQYRLLFQDNPNPMWVFDLETLKILEVNEVACLHYGYTSEEFLRMSLTDLRAVEHPVQGQPHPPQTALPEAGVQGMVFRHQRKDKTEMDMELNWLPLVFRGKLAALTVATDVTIRRQAAHQNATLGALSHHLSAVTMAAQAARFICEATDELFHWDDFSLDLYSASRDEASSLLTITTVGGKRVEIPPASLPKTDNSLVRRVIEHGAELVADDTQGGITMVAPVRKGPKVIGVLFIHGRQSHRYNEHDLVTLQMLADQCGGALQRVQVEEELRQSQRRFRDLFQNSPDAIFVEDLQGRVLDVNPSACSLSGLTYDKLIGKSTLDELLSPAHREAGRTIFQRLVSGEITWIESEGIRADGQLVPVEIRAGRIEYDGRPALLFHVRDITERNAAEATLRNSETLFRSVWENSVDGMRLTDEKGLIVAINGAFCRQVGMSHEQLEDHPFTVMYSASTDRAALLRQHREMFRNGEAQPKRECEIVLHDGRKAVFEMADSYIESNGKPRLLLSLFSDITVQKQMAEQLRQSQKLEAIGQLAGGIAHDFNNILTIILGHASLLLLSPLDAKATVSAQQIKQASERAAGLTRQLLTFGRKHIVNTRPIDLNQTVSKVSDMLGRLLGEDISLQINFASQPAVVEADASMVEQILLNLSVNSRDAMPHGGQLVISIDECVVDAKHVRRFSEARTGNFIRLSHMDSGCGIPPENLPRIFEPFFTTKEIGKGTGLGLATVFGIVKQHNGWIEVESEPGKGARFHIFLPASTRLVAKAEQYDTQLRIQDGTETILIVEDERDLREIVTSTLTHHGYRVFQAADGHNALDIWREQKDNIDLVFTDVIMPGGINGRELAEKLWAEKPDLKIIFSTGYGANALGSDYKLDLATNYLPKPYLPQALVRLVRRCLDKKRCPDSLS
jgi:PAS domain S-box-containing protein